jgi:phosphoserine phosphatase RsbU/P
MNWNKRGIDRRKIRADTTFPIRQANGEVIMKERRSVGRRCCNYIAEQKIFSETPYYLIEPILLECPIKQLQEGEILIAKGEENFFLYLLISGSLHISFSLTDIRESFTIQPGECVGEVSLLDGNLTSAFVIAAEPSEVVVIHEDIFWEQLAIFPNILKNLLQSLSAKVRRNNEAIIKTLEQQIKYQHFQKELRVAAEIQMNMLPKVYPLFPQHPQVNVYGMMHSAREVGGDFYDAFAIDNKYIFIAIGDVSGKGIPAALFMVKTMTLLRANITHHKQFPKLLTTVNKLLCENNEANMFVTLFVGLLNVVTGKLYYMNGGHNPPLLAHKNSSFIPLIVPNNVLVGVYDLARYKVSKIQLQVGDTLVLYTDGVTDAENSQGELFSIAQAIDVLTTTNSADVKTMVDTLSDKIAEFCDTQPQSDDITVLILQYLG